MSARLLDRRSALWTTITVAHVVPFLVVAVAVVALTPLAIPVALLAVAHAWWIPELYANRGAKVLRPPRRPPHADPAAESTALGLLADLVGHDPRELLHRTGVALERGRLGVWLLGPAGAVLVRPGGRRALCLCVRVPDPALPDGDRIAHLLLALREDEAGFATVANLAFSGAAWRVRRRLPARTRAALDAARAAAHDLSP